MRGIRLILRKLHNIVDCNDFFIFQGEYDNWAKGEPHWRGARSCVMAHSDGQNSGKWENINCYLLAGSICQVPRAVNGNEFVYLRSVCIASCETKT